MRAGLAIPDASTAGAHSRPRKWFEVHQPSPWSREDQRYIQSRRNGIKRRHGATGQRLPPGAGRLAELNGVPAAHGAEHIQEAFTAIDVAAFERLPLLG